MTGLVLRMKSPENFGVFIAMGLPLLILSCGVSNEKYSEAEVSYRSGVALQQAERLEEAIASYDEALRLDPQLAAAYAVYNNRGRSYAELGRYQRAIDDLDESIRLFPRYGSAYRNRARSYAGLGHYEKAIKDYDEATRLNPRLARFDADPTHPLRSIKRLSETMLTAPNLSDSMERGRSYAALGRYEQAIEDYTEVIRKDPQIVMAYVNRAIAFTLMGRDQEAQQDVDRAVALGVQREDLVTEIYIAKRRR